MPSLVPLLLLSTALSLSAARLAAGLPLTKSCLALRCVSVRLSSEPDEFQLLRNAAVAGATVNLGTAASDARSGLDALGRRSEERLRALGALDGPPLPPPRSAFTTRSSDETRAEANAMLEQMRKKKSGEAEAEYAAVIGAAQKMAQSWLDAGLPQRAEKELRGVVGYVSYGTEFGGEFHLQLAQVIDKCGRPLEARRMLMRVVEETSSSSIRWRAQQQAGFVATGLDSSSSNSELSSLFGKHIEGGGWAQ
eukprot:scaffold310601_cov31-Tisochrysis_lutea.AAC.1